MSSVWVPSVLGVVGHVGAHPGAAGSLMGWVWGLSVVVAAIVYGVFVVVKK